MPGEDLFKRYLEIGASVLGMSRERAENIVKDLVASGEVARGQATKAADWLVERGRAGADELSEMVRREVRQQVAALGLATKDDLDQLEARLGAGSPAAAGRVPAGPGKVGSVPKRAAATSTETGAPVQKAGGGSEKASAPLKKAAAAGEKAAVDTPARRSAATAVPTGTGSSAGAPKKKAGAKKAAPATTAAQGKGAGITRSASVRRSPGRSGSGGSDAAPPAGGAVPPKG